MVINAGIMTQISVTHNCFWSFCPFVLDKLEHIDSILNFPRYAILKATHRVLVIYAKKELLSFSRINSIAIRLEQ